MLILLDIDGVMVPANSWRKPEFLQDGFAAFTSKSVEALNRILFETNANILLTTSHKTKYTLSQWKNIFKNRGVAVNTIGRLGENKTHSDRKTEIIQWYDSPRNKNEEFVIIDDDKKLNDLPNHLRENLILTSGSVGLTDELAETAIDKLKHNNAHFSY